MSASHRIAQLLHALRSGTAGNGDRERLEIEQFLFAGSSGPAHDLIAHFTPQLLAFATDPSPAMRLWVVSVVERVCRLEARFLPLALATLGALSQDSVAAVAKDVLLAATWILPFALKFVCVPARMWTELHAATWRTMRNCETQLLSRLDSASDGVRCLAIKLAEQLVLSFTPDERRTKELSLPQLPELSEDNPDVKLAVLVQDADAILLRLLTLLDPSSSDSAALRIQQSPTNVAVLLTSFGLLARLRPRVLELVVPALLRFNTKKMRPAHATRALHSLKSVLSLLIKFRPAQAWSEMLTNAFTGVVVVVACLEHLFVLELGFEDESVAARSSVAAGSKIVMRYCSFVLLASQLQFQ